MDEQTKLEPSVNVLGEALQPCSHDPLTGFFRNGCCDTSDADVGSHTVCAVMTEEFLEFSKRVGNDLSTPRPEFGFAGLKPGDQWCLCAARWSQAFAAGKAPRVRLSATHIRALEATSLEDLRSRSADLA
ncbi:MAG: DUF2237 domain-containing protein [Pseudomonadota bacterium]